MSLRGTGGGFWSNLRRRAGLRKNSSSGSSLGRVKCSSLWSCWSAARSAAILSMSRKGGGGRRRGSMVRMMDWAGESMSVGGE